MLRYLNSLAFFFLGGDIPSTFIEKATSVVPISKFLVIIIGYGSFLGSLIGCCMSRKKMSLVVSLVHIAIYGIVMGCLTLTVDAFGVIAYVTTYCFLFGLFRGKQVFMFVCRSCFLSFFFVFLFFVVFVLFLLITFFP